MVRIVFLYFLALGLGFPVYAESAPAKVCGSEFLPCESPLKLKGLRSVTILQAWTRVSQEDVNVNCSQLELTSEIVKYYFSRAGEISRDDSLELVNVSPCRAHGTILTRDGRQAEWVLGILREGKLKWNNGKTVPTFCAKCSGPPFFK